MKKSHSTSSLQRFNQQQDCSSAPCLVVLLLVLAAWPAAIFAQVTNNTPLTTFVNPPGGPAVFGTALSALGNDRVIIGASAASTGATGAGVAVLF